MAKTKRRFDRRLPPIGTKLKGTLRGREYFAEIAAAPNLKEGRGVLYGGKLFPTMTAAAREITKNSVNGWRFWRL